MRFRIAPSFIVGVCLAQGSSQLAAVPPSRVGDLIDLALVRFTQLAPADHEVLMSAVLGVAADFSDRDDDVNDPLNADAWPPERVVSAEVVAWLCTDKTAAAFVSHRGIWIQGARIDGVLDLRDATVPFPLLFIGCRFVQVINVQDARLRGLYLDGSRAPGIAGDGLQAGENIFLRDGFTSTGEVRLIGARIGGNFECSGGKFFREYETAINGDRIQVEGSVLFRNGFESRGAVRLAGARIGGELGCQGATFSHPDLPALYAAGAQVQGNVVFRHGALMNGLVSFASARVEGSFVWRELVAPNQTSLDMRSASVGTLSDAADSWPAQGKLQLHGLTYTWVHDTSPVDAVRRLDWLHRQDVYQPQPYEQMATVLRAQGYEKDAREILMAKEEDWARHIQLPWYRRALHAVLRGTVGYGHDPWRVLPYIGGVLTLGVFFFGLGAKFGVMTPTNDRAYVAQSDGERGKRRISPDYPAFNAIIYSIDEFTPLVNLRQGDFWLPNPNKDVRQRSDAAGRLLHMYARFLQFYLWIHILAGWTLTTLPVAGLTELVRR